MSIAGGMHKAVERGASIRCRTIQVFVKNSNQWRGKPLSSEQIANYKNLLAKSNINPVIAHSTYLINLCSIDKCILAKSREIFLDELSRCEQLGILYYNFHPGSHMGRGMADGIKLISESLNIIHNKTAGCAVKSVLETTAGMGTSIGHTFEQLQKIIDLVENKELMSVCVDTCHIFAAGYDIRTEAGWEQTWKEFSDVIGFERLSAIHVNDSKRELGSRVDRHEHIGKGYIGKNGFRFLMNDPHFVTIPKILETPKGEDMKEDKINLRTLKKLVRRDS
jgi:deoxyribonuclease-4